MSFLDQTQPSGNCPIHLLSVEKETSSFEYRKTIFITLTSSTLCDETIQVGTALYPVATHWSYLEGPPGGVCVCMDFTSTTDWARLPSIPKERPFQNILVQQILKLLLQHVCDSGTHAQV